MSRIFGWIKHLPRIFLLLLLLYLGGSAALIYARYNWPESFMGEIDLILHHQGDRPWRGRVNLIPEILQTGKPFEIVDSELENQGYKQVSHRTILPKYRNEAYGNGRVYLRSLGQSLCHPSNYVFVKFDDEKRLVSATAIREDGGCF